MCCLMSLWLLHAGYGQVFPSFSPRSSGAGDTDLDWTLAEEKILMVCGDGGKHACCLCRAVGLDKSLTCGTATATTAAVLVMHPQYGCACCWARNLLPGFVNQPPNLLTAGCGPVAVPS